MRALLLAALTATLACGKKGPRVFEAYRDANAGFSLEAPKGWTLDAAPAAPARPALVTSFVGDPQPQDEGVPLGAVLSVTRLSRKASDKLIGETKALFPDDGPAAAESKPFARDYEHGGPTPMHQSAPVIAMRAEGKVFRTADAFYVVELRGVREKFELNRPALVRALATFRPAP